MGSFTDALDGLGNWFTDAAKRADHTVQDLGHVALWAPGLAMDAARWATPGKSEDKDRWLSLAGSGEALGNLIKGDKDVTLGWTLSSLFHGLNSGLSGLDNLTEAPFYKADAAHRGDPISWGDAFEAASNTNIAETVGMLGGMPMPFSGRTTFNDPVREKLGGDSFDLAEPDAWDKYKEASGHPTALQVQADYLATVAMFKADPFIVGSKIKSAYSAAKESKLFGAAEGNTFNEFVEKSASESRRFDKLFGTTKTEPKADDSGELVDTIVTDREGALDRWKSSGEIYKGLRLDRIARGGEVADLLDATRHLSAADRINARRDIVAAMYGDVSALTRLNRTAPAIGYKFSNAVKGVGNHSYEAAAADVDKAADILTGAAPATTDTPEFVAKVKAEVESQPDFYNWLHGQVDPTTHLKLPLRETAAGNRAVARLRGEGISRNGTALRTGYNAVDAPASWILLNGANLPGARFAAKGLAIAGVSPALRAGAKVSDALRGRVTYGSLSVEDDNASIVGLVVQDMMRRAGATPDRVDHYLSMVTKATNASTRAMAVQRAQNEAIRTIADKTGHDAETVLSVAAGPVAWRKGSVIDGQAYATSKVDDARVPGGERSVDVVYLPDGEETLIVPVLNTQTPNKVTIIDIDRAQKWLTRDHYLRAIGNRFRAGAAGENPLRREIADKGFRTALPELANSKKMQMLHARLERANSVWKSSALLLRPGSYAIRNTAEEGMRTWALHRTAQLVDRIQSQNKNLSLTGKVKGNKVAADKILAEYRVEELKDRVAMFEDEPFVNEVNLIKKELKNLRSERTRLQKQAPAKDPLSVASGGRSVRKDRLSDVESSIRFYETHPTLLRHEALADEIFGIRSDIDAVYKKALTGTPEQGTRTLTIGGHEVTLPEAYADDAFWDIIGTGGGFDNATADIGMRLMHTLRGQGQSPYLSVKGLTESRPGVEDVVRNHLDTWSHILNFQIRQDPAGRVALRARAEGADAEGIADAVEKFITSNAEYRAKNPMRSHDPEYWAGDIGKMVEDYVPNQELAAILAREDDTGRVTGQWLKDNFKLSERPDVHLSASDAVIGAHSRAMETLTSRMFQSLDRMSLQRISRHPMFSLYFEEAQERLVAGALRRAEFEGKTHISVDEINQISHRARVEASHKLKQTFYDNHVRSSAAHQMRFIYPFFAAHQNSMSFWGRAFMEDPSKLRQMQLAFQAPSSLGLVVDKDGNKVKPGEFVGSDHRVLMQMPERWGGPNPLDPDAKGSGWRIPLGSFNLIMQNGSILNPGAGPIAAVPAGYIQKHYADHENISDVMKWFNPFGAPKDASSGIFPTPIKRGATLWKSYMDKNSQEYLTMYGITMTDSVVEFAQENDRPPNDAETRVLEEEAGKKVRAMAWLRFGLSLGSPVQPQPVSAFEGLKEEFRRMQENSTKPFEAENKFLDLYGDTLMALTKSSSLNRAHLDPTAGTVASLRAHKALLKQVPEEVWQTVVGPEGKGGFSIDAFRWMQDFKVSQTGDKLIDSRDQNERLFEAAEAMGWREYKKVDDAFRNQALSQGTTVEKDPVLKAARKSVLDGLKKNYPQWAEAYDGGGRSGEIFEHRYIDGLRTISKNRALLNDTNRYDIQMVAKYLDVRDAFKDILAERDAAGGSAEITAKANADLALAYASIVTAMRDENDHFADYTFAPIIQKDPMYREDVLEGSN